MTKYRVIQHGVLYYPQVRVLPWIWKTIQEDKYGYDTIEEALGAIKNHKRKKQGPVVVWRSNKDEL